MAGVSPDRLCPELKKRYNCDCNPTKLRAYRKCFFPHAKTIRNAEIIEVDVNVIPEPEEFTFEELETQRLRIGIKTGMRIEYKLDNNEDLDAKETQLFSTCCKPLDKEIIVNNGPEIELTEEDVEWINHVSDYNK